MKLKTIKIFIITFLLVLSPALFEACDSNNGAEANLNVSRDKTEMSDLDEIRERGRLVVAADYNSTSYFIYRGQPMGYQYQMLQELAKYLDLRLDVQVSNDIGETFNELNTGDIDLIAINLTVTSDRKKKVAFTYPHSQTRQVLVQRMPENYGRLNPRQVEDSLLRNQLDLAG